MSFNGQKKQTIFITKNFKGTLDSKTDIVLSPEFYWAKRVTLNVKLAYEVKKMAPSLFEGMLPDGNFEFKVFKLSKNEYLITAFNLSNIKQELSDIGIDMEFVSKIFLLESEFSHCEVSLGVDDKFGVACMNGVMVYTPLQFLEVNGTMEEALTKKKFSKHHIYTQQFQKIQIEPNQLSFFVLILILLSSILTLDTIKIQKNITLLENQKLEFINDNNLPQTSFQIKSMQEELQNIDTKQNDLRKAISYIQKFKLNKNESFSLIDFKNKKLKFNISLENEQRESKFKTYLSKNKKSNIILESNL